MNALFVLRPAKLWAFNFGHPCPPSKKGEVLLLGQAEPTMVGIEFDRTSIPLAFRRAECLCVLVLFCIRAKLWAHTLRHPCLACPSRCIEPLNPHNHYKRTIIPSPRTITLAFKWKLWLSPSFILKSVPIRIANPRSAIRQKELSVACYHSLRWMIQQKHFKQNTFSTNWPQA